jgi:hypothetical protein
MHHRQYSGLLWATPNGGKRNAREAARLKEEGVLAGVADLQLAVIGREAGVINGVLARYVRSGLFIELKSGPGKQTPAQIAFEQAVTAQGYQYSVCRTLEEFMNVINTYLK